MAETRPAGSETIIGADVQIKGEISYEGTMKVEGKIEGKISSKGRLALSKGGQITADVVVGNVSLDGSFKGNVTAAERIELTSSANVLGDIRSPKLIIAEGATFVGNCHVSPDALKDVKVAEFVTAIPATPIKK